MWVTELLVNEKNVEGFQAIKRPGSEKHVSRTYLDYTKNFIKWEPDTL